MRGCRLTFPPKVTANPFLFTTVIQNLVTHALKYCLPGGEIMITTRPERLLIGNSGNKPLNPAGLFQPQVHAEAVVGLPLGDIYGPAPGFLL